MNSFIGIEKKDINSKRIYTRRLAYLYTELFRNDDFIDECIKSLSNKRASNYELPNYSTHNNLAIRIQDNYCLDIMLPENYTKITHQDEPLYHRIIEWGGNDIRKIIQCRLSDLLWFLFDRSEGFTKYVMYNVIQRATDAQIVECIKFDPILLSNNNYMSLYDDEELPEDAKHDVVIKCPDGEVKAHRLILTITSKLFADVVNCNKITPIEIAFPFSEETTELLIETLHEQKISSSIDMDTINALEYVQAIDKSEFISQLVSNIKI
ncbi:hypothetical protein F-M6_0234 [Faustovirus]|nr:hypothetical protein F-M6_0234 [Faustovirus]